MKAISLHGPWAQWVAMGLKDIESRTHDRFACLEGQKIAIHLAQHWDVTALETACPYMGDFGNYERLLRLTEMERASGGGHLLCTVKVFGCMWATDDQFLCFDQWSKRALINVQGKYLLFLGEVTPVEPVWLRGGRGIFNVPDYKIKARALTKRDELWRAFRNGQPATDNEPSA